MVVNFALWSPIISLLAISLLFPLRTHYNGHQISKIYAALFAFPACVSSIYLFIITSFGSIITTKTIHPSMIQAFFTLHTSWSTAAITLSTTISTVFLIFLYNKINAAKTTPIFSLFFALIIAISSIPDQLVRLSLFILGTIIASFLLLPVYNQTNKTTITGNFLLQRISDFLALLALIFILVDGHNNTTNNPITSYELPSANSLIIYNISVLIRIISAVFFTERTVRNGYLSPHSAIKLYLGIGPQILLIQFKSVIVLDGSIQIFMLIAGVILLVFSLLKPIFQRESEGYIESTFSILIISSFIILWLGINDVALGLICVLITLYPICSTTRVNAARSSKIPTPSSANYIPLLNHKFYLFLLRSLRNVAMSSINAINSIYSGLFFYYLPQLIITALQIPLRLFHNGNIQRSLFLVIIMLFCYNYWWRN